MLHRHRAGLVLISRRRRGVLFGALAALVLFSSCRTAPEVAPAPESLPLPAESALYLLISPRERGDLAYVLLESFDIGPAIANRIDLAGISIDRDPGTAAPPKGSVSPDSIDGRRVVVAVRGNLPTRRLARALRRSDEWRQESDATGRDYFRQEEGPWILTLPGDGLLVLGNGAPEQLPREPPAVSPWPPDFVERFATVPIAAFVPSPGGGAISTPLGGVLPLRELRFYVAAAEEGTPSVDTDTPGSEPGAAAEAAAPWVNLSGEAVLDNERSARAFESILRLLALGIAAEMEMEPGRVRELLEVAQRENLVTFTAGPLETSQLFTLSSELLQGYGGAEGFLGGAP
jgi:hypothetical protein